MPISRESRVPQGHPLLSHLGLAVPTSESHSACRTSLVGGASSWPIISSPMEANSPATSFGPKAAVLDTKGKMGGMNGKERKLPLAAERSRE